MVFGDVSTGAENDLQRATEMALHMVTHYGMSDRLGLSSYGAAGRGIFLDAAGLPQQHAFSEHTAQLIDEEVAALLEQARKRVERTLTEQRAMLDALAACCRRKRRWTGRCSMPCWRRLQPRFPPSLRSGYSLKHIRDAGSAGAS
jgi:cell division protease FtsH